MIKGEASLIHTSLSLFLSLSLSLIDFLVFWRITHSLDTHTKQLDFFIEGFTPSKFKEIIHHHQHKILKLLNVFMNS